MRETKENSEQGVDFIINSIMPGVLFALIFVSSLTTFLGLLEYTDFNERFSSVVIGLVVFAFGIGVYFLQIVIIIRLPEILLKLAEENQRKIVFARSANSSQGKFAAAWLKISSVTGGGERTAAIIFLMIFLLILFGASTTYTAAYLSGTAPTLMNMEDAADRLRSIADEQELELRYLETLNKTVNAYRVQFGCTGDLEKPLAAELMQLCSLLRELNNEKTGAHVILGIEQKSGAISEQLKKLATFESSLTEKESLWTRLQPRNTANAQEKRKDTAFKDLVKQYRMQQAETISLILERSSAYPWDSLPGLVEEIKIACREDAKCAILSSKLNQIIMEAQSFRESLDLHRELSSVRLKSPVYRIIYYPYLPAWAMAIFLDFAAWIFFYFAFRRSVDTFRLKLKKVSFHQLTAAELAAGRSLLDAKIGRLAKVMLLDVHGYRGLCGKAAADMIFASVMLGLVFFFELTMWFFLFNTVMNHDPRIFGANSLFIALPLATVVALVIFILERQIVTADDGASKREFWLAFFGRFVLIFFSALITSQPVELLAFDGPINRRIHEETVIKYASGFSRDIIEERERMDAFREERENLETKLQKQFEAISFKQAEAELDQWYQQKAGKDNQYNRKLEQYNRRMAAYRGYQRECPRRRAAVQEADTVIGTFADMSAINAYLGSVRTYGISRVSNLNDEVFDATFNFHGDSDARERVRGYLVNKFYLRYFCNLDAQRARLESVQAELGLLDDDRKAHNLQQERYEENVERRRESLINRRDELSAIISFQENYQRELAKSRRNFIRQIRLRGPGREPFIHVLPSLQDSLNQFAAAVTASTGLLQTVAASYLDLESEWEFKDENYDWHQRLLILRYLREGRPAREVAELATTPNGGSGTFAEEEQANRTNDQNRRKILYEEFGLIPEKGYGPDKMKALAEEARDFDFRYRLIFFIALFIPISTILQKLLFPLELKNYYRSEFQHDIANMNKLK